MGREDYLKYYIQGSDHYLIPKDIFDELFNEMENWKKEAHQYKEVIDKLKNIINEMINCGYIVENGESAVNYIATGGKSEFGTRAKVLLDILKEVK